MIHDDVIPTFLHWIVPSPSPLFLFRGIHVFGFSLSFPLISLSSLAEGSFLIFGQSLFFACQICVFLLVMFWVYLNFFASASLFYLAIRKKYTFPEEVLKWMDHPRLKMIVEWTNDVIDLCQIWSLLGSYGLFARMTTDRGELDSFDILSFSFTHFGYLEGEIIIEGSDNGEDWQMYQFKYKANGYVKTSSVSVNVLPMI
jgi:hypothetical protein